MGDPSRVRLCLRERSIEPIAAAHNDLVVGNVSFAIRKRTFAAAALNDRFGPVALYIEDVTTADPSLAIVEKALGPEHPDVAQILENYAALLRETGRADEAERMDARAKVIRAKYQ